jgi:hypothetical protein
VEEVVFSEVAVVVLVLDIVGLVVQGLLAEDEAHQMAHECAYGLAKRAYRFPEATYVTR